MSYCIFLPNKITQNDHIFIELYLCIRIFLSYYVLFFSPAIMSYVIHMNFVCLDRFYLQVIQVFVTFC